MEITPTPEGAFTRNSVKQLPFEAPSPTFPYTQMTPDITSEMQRPGLPTTGADVLNLEQNIGQQRFDQMFKGADAQAAAKQLDNAVTDVVNQAIPEYGLPQNGQMALRQQFKTLSDAFERLGIDPKKIMTTDPITGDIKVDPLAVKGLANLVKQNVSTDVAAKAGFQSFQHALDQLQSVSGEGFGSSVDALTQKMQDLKAAQKIAQGTYLPGFGPIGRVSNLGAIANIAGLGVNKISPMLPNTANLAGIFGANNRPDTASQIAFPKEKPSLDTGMQQNLYKASPEDLKAISSKLQMEPALKFLGNHLANALADNNEQMKNAALFAIAQNPQARQLLKGTQ
jgi:hypothetical protein